MKSINWSNYTDEYAIMRQMQKCFEEKAYTEAEKGLKFLLHDFITSEQTQYLILLQKLMFYVIGWKTIPENRNLEWAQSIWDLRTEIEIFLEDSDEYLTHLFLQSAWNEAFAYAKDKFEFENDTKINLELTHEEVFEFNYKLNYPAKDE